MPKRYMFSRKNDGRENTKEFKIASQPISRLSHNRPEVSHAFPILRHLCSRGITYALDFNLASIGLPWNQMRKMRLATENLAKDGKNKSRPSTHLISVEVNSCL
jgi:hypothetical protein